MGFIEFVVSVGSIGFGGVRNQMLVAGCSILDVGGRMPDAGYCIPDTGSWMTQ